MSTLCRNKIQSTIYLGTSRRFGTSSVCLKSQKPKTKQKESRGDTAISRSISWLLRHGAEAERLPMRPDGYVPVQDLLGHPRLHGLDVFTLEKIVKEDPKKRFHLSFEPLAYNAPGSPLQINSWWIRANQGHSLSNIELDLKPVNNPNEIEMAVHGTTRSAWKSISKQGLSTMKRNHIHLAQGFIGSNNNAVSGMRKSSQILIHINLEKALNAGIKFYLSSNGVVLTPGNEFGILERQFFARVEKVKGTTVTPLLGWEIFNNTANGDGFQVPKREIRENDNRTDYHQMLTMQDGDLVIRNGRG